MKVLFIALPSSLSVQNIATRSELMANHVNAGDDVFVLKCGGELPFCYSNSLKLKSVCFKCSLLCDSCTNVLNVSTENIFYLNKDIIFRDIPEEFQTIDDLKQFNVLGINLGFGVVSYMISFLREANFNVMLHKQRINSILKASVLVYESTLDLLNKIKPDVVYIWNGRFFDSWPALNACKKLGIVYRLFESINGFKYDEKKEIKYKYSFVENDLLHSLSPCKRDILKQWSESCFSDDIKFEIGKLFFEKQIKRKNLFVFCNEQKFEKLPVDFNFSKKNIVIFNSSFDEYAAFDEWKNPIYLNENEGIKKIVTSLIDNEDIYIYLRIHPNLKKVNSFQIQELQDMERQNYKNLKIVWPEEDIDSYSLLRHCNKVVTFGSTIGVEACYWDKPSVLIGRALYEDLNCCYVPKNHQEVLELIQQDLQPKPKNGVIIYGFWTNTWGVEYKYFKPEGDLTSGTFKGIDLWKNVSLKNRFKHKYLVLKDFGIKNIVKIKLDKLKNKLYENI